MNVANLIAEKFGNCNNRKKSRDDFQRVGKTFYKDFYEWAKGVKHTLNWFFVWSKVLKLSEYLCDAICCVERDDKSVNKYYERAFNDQIKMLRIERDIKHLKLPVYKREVERVLTQLAEMRLAAEKQKELFYALHVAVLKEVASDYFNRTIVAMEGEAI